MRLLMHYQIWGDVIDISMRMLMHDYICVGVIDIAMTLLMLYQVCIEFIDIVMGLLTHHQVLDLITSITITSTVLDSSRLSQVCKTLIGNKILLK
jgi:hypothetical protein